MRNTMDMPLGMEEAERQDFDRLVRDLRPKLFRYCARMTGSPIDGEDALQQALAKAVEALPRAGHIAHPEAWLFRIAHNVAIDLVRSRNRREAEIAGEDPDLQAEPAMPIEARATAATALRTLMALPAAQRSCVILADVLGYSVAEVGGILGTSIASVKASLHRGRARLRTLAPEAEETAAPVLAEPERSRLATYVEHFNARDFDALRDLLADDVRADLVARRQLAGKAEVGHTYFGNYAALKDGVFASGFVHGLPAIVVSDPDDHLHRPTYFILLEWSGDRVAAIRDFYHARYAVEGADIVVLR